MSLVILSKTDREKASDFFAKVSNETGIQFDLVNNTENNGITITKITFTDGNYISELGYNLRNGYIYDSTKYTVFADDSSNLFIITKTTKWCGMNQNQDLSTHYFAFITNLSGEIVDIAVYGSSMSRVVNIPESVNENQNNNSIKIFPLYFGYEYSLCKYGFPKNVFINYERKFDAGLKFIDQNGNRFVTLGTYLLYKED